MPGEERIFNPKVCRSCSSGKVDRCFEKEKEKPLANRSWRSLFDLDRTQLPAAGSVEPGPRISRTPDFPSDSPGHSLKWKLSSDRSPPAADFWLKNQL